MINLRIAVLISGGGLTLKNLIHWKNRSELPVCFQVVISSDAMAPGLQFAREADLTTSIIERSDFENEADFSEQVFKCCRDHEVELVVMGGFLEHVKIPADFENRVINIHPSLVPAFSGQGFYGLRVHKAALAMGVKLTGCTVHFVDDLYDHGPIIAQRSCPVFDEDSPESLQGRVAELERQLYPEVIAAIARNQVHVDGRHVTMRVIV